MQCYINKKALNSKARADFVKREAQTARYMKAKHKSTDRVIAYAQRIGARRLAEAETVTYKEYLLVMSYDARQRELELNLQADAIAEHKQKQ